MTIGWGVMRTVMRFTEEPLDGDPDTVGSLIAHLPDDDQPFYGEVVTYTLDAGRLRDLLDLAAGGADIDGLVLSLDAAALLSDTHSAPEDDDDDAG